MVNSTKNRRPINNVYLSLISTWIIAVQNAKKNEDINKRSPHKEERQTSFGELCSHEEKEKDDKAIDLKIMEGKEVANKGNGFVLYRIGCD